MADQDYWIEIGENDPWWGVLSEDRYHGLELAPADRDAFFAQGERDIDFAVATIRRHLCDSFAPRNALDFGCGVGRLMLAMRRHVKAITGVDISPGMLSRAAAEARSRGVEVRLATEVPEGQFDWINSFIVFQHIEPAAGMRLLEQLLDHLAPDGFISLHFTAYRDSRIWHRGPGELEYARFDGNADVYFRRRATQEMPLYEYDLSAVTCQLVAHGIENLYLHHTDHCGLHGVWIFGQQGH